MESDLSELELLRETMISKRIGLPGIPAESEEIMVFRDISLAKLTDCPVHIAHVSTKGSVEIIRRAKEEGIQVIDVSNPTSPVKETAAPREVADHAP